MAERAADAPAAGRAAMPAPAIDVQIYVGFESLPDRLAAFFAAAGARNFFASIPWYRTLLATAGPDSDKPRIYAATLGGRPVAALVAREREEAG